MNLRAMLVCTQHGRTCQQDEKSSKFK
jgi:hypothetical protein